MFSFVLFNNGWEKKRKEKEEAEKESVGNEGD